MLLYHDEYQTLRHDRSHSLLEMDWTDATSKLIETSYVNRLKNVANCVERYRPQHFLANLEELVYKGSTNVEEWIQNEIYSKLGASGVRKIAFIKSNDTLTRILFEHIFNKKSPDAIETKSFDKVETARRWLIEDDAII